MTIILKVVKGGTVEGLQERGVVVSGHNGAAAVKRKTGDAAVIQFKAPESGVIQPQERADEHFVYGAVRHENEFTFPNARNGVPDEG